MDPRETPCSKDRGRRAPAGARTHEPRAVLNSFVFVESDVELALSGSILGKSVESGDLAPRHSLTGTSRTCQLQAGGMTCLARHTRALGSMIIVCV